MRKSAVLTLLFGALSVLIFSHPAFALSCAKPALEAEFERSGYVFAGTAIDTNDVTYTARFKVNRLWKGEMDEIDRMPIHVAGAHMMLEEGRQYLITARERDGEIHVNVCGYIQEWTPEIEEEIYAAFGRGEVIVDNSPQGYYLMIGVAMLLLSADFIRTRLRG